MLLLAGFAGVRGAEIPSDGGTLPDGYVMYLPVVEKPYRYTGDLSDLPEDCPYKAVLFSPDDGVFVRSDDLLVDSWVIVGSDGYEVRSNYSRPLEEEYHVYGFWQLEGLAGLRSPAPMFCCPGTALNQVLGRGQLSPCAEKSQAAP